MALRAGIHRAGAAALTILLSDRAARPTVEGTEFSPGVRRMMATVGSETSFE